MHLGRRRQKPGSSPGLCASVAPAAGGRVTAWTWTVPGEPGWKESFALCLNAVLGWERVRACLAWEQVSPNRQETCTWKKKLFWVIVSSIYCPHRSEIRSAKLLIVCFNSSSQSPIFSLSPSQIKLPRDLGFQEHGERAVRLRKACISGVVYIAAHSLFLCPSRSYGPQFLNFILSISSE